MVGAEVLNLKPSQARLNHPLRRLAPSKNKNKKTRRIVQSPRGIQRMKRKTKRREKIGKLAPRRFDTTRRKT